jgi:hypothetical protein
MYPNSKVKVNTLQKKTHKQTVKKVHKEISRFFSRYRINILHIIKTGQQKLQKKTDCTGQRNINVNTECNTYGKYNKVHQAPGIHINFLLESNNSELSQRVVHQKQSLLFTVSCNKEIFFLSF